MVVWTWTKKEILMPNDIELPVMGENLSRLDDLEVDQAALARLAGGDPRWAGLPEGGFDDGFAFPAYVCIARELMRARQRHADLRAMVPSLAAIRLRAARGEVAHAMVERTLRDLLALLGAPTGGG